MRISDWSSDVCSSDLPWTQKAAHGLHPAICWYLALASAWSCRFWCWQFRMPSIMAILAWLLQAPHYSVLREDRWGFRCSAQSLPRIWRMDWPRECRLEQVRSEEHTSELQSLMRISYAVYCLKKKTLT